MAKYSKQKDGRYRTKLVTGLFTDEGKPIIKYLSAKTQRELDQKVEEAKQEISEAKMQFSSDTNFYRYADAWITTFKANKSNATISMYRNALENHIKTLHDMSLNEITRTDIQEVINACPSARLSKIVSLTLKQIFRSAQDDHIIKESPYLRIDTPEYHREERRALTKEEKAAISKCDFNSRQQAFIYTLLGTGIRPAEMYALTWNDIDFENGKVNINKALEFVYGVEVKPPKNKFSMRSVDAPQFVLTALSEWKVKCTTDIIFASAKGTYRDKNRYHSEWMEIKKKIVEQLGYDTKLSPYYFRHNFATELYYSGVSVKEAQRLLGHSTLDMIMKIYAHLDEEKENTKQKLNQINFLQ